MQLTKMPNKGRIDEIDYLKCIFILLMIAFHLVYISDKYPYIKQIVYTFHMPAFLIISGYLANTTKNIKQFFKTIMWIFIPYAVMEIGYVIMSSIMPVREKVDEVSVIAMFVKTFIKPLGPYWYLHTLIICSITYFAVFKALARFKIITRFIALGLCFFGMSYWLDIINFANVIYFMIGVAIQQSKVNFIDVFQPNPLALVPIIVLCCFQSNLDRATLAGVGITYLVISMLLYSYRHLPKKVRNFTNFVGKNTLVILLFSPIFTMMAKILVPLFDFDPTGFCFLVTALIITVGGCLAMAWGADRLKISRFFFGKKNVLTPY